MCCLICFIFLFGLLLMIIVVVYVVEKFFVLKVLVIGYCGVSVLWFEYMLVLYVKVIVDGVDVIELDLVMIRDGVMVVCYENEIGGIIDVVDYFEFVVCKIIKVIDGQCIIGWFIEDFIFVELKILCVCECLFELCGMVYDGQFQIVMLDEIIDFVVVELVVWGCVIGLILEIKYGIYFQYFGLLMEDVLFVMLVVYVYMCIVLVEIQLFEIVNLKYLCGKLGKMYFNIILLQLIDELVMYLGDVLVVGGMFIYVQMIMLVGFKMIVQYVDVIGFDYYVIILYIVDGCFGMFIVLVYDVYVVGFQVYLYIFCLENIFLVKDFWQGDDFNIFNVVGMLVQLKVYLDIGIDVFFIDDLVLGWQVVDVC